MNFSSFVGRLSPAFYANALGIENIIAVTTGCCSIMILGMIGIKSVAGVVSIGIIYGFFAGICKPIWLLQNLSCLSEHVLPIYFSDIALLAPLLAILNDDFSELGWVSNNSNHSPVGDRFGSVRMGIAYAISGLSLLYPFPEADHPYRVKALATWLVKHLLLLFLAILKFSNLRNTH